MSARLISPRRRAPTSAKQWNFLRTVLLSFPAPEHSSSGAIIKLHPIYEGQGLRSAGTLDAHVSGLLPFLFFFFSFTGSISSLPMERSKERRPWTRSHGQWLERPDVLLCPGRTLRMLAVLAWLLKTSSFAVKDVSVWMIDEVGLESLGPSDGSEVSTGTRTGPVPTQASAFWTGAWSVVGHFCKCGLQATCCSQLRRCPGCLGPIQSEAGASCPPGL